MKILENISSMGIRAYAAQPSWMTRRSYRFKGAPLRWILKAGLGTISPGTLYILSIRIGNRCRVRRTTRIASAEPSYGICPEVSNLLRANGLIELEFTGVADTHDNGAFDRIAFFGKGHATGNAVKVLNSCQGIPNGFAVFFDITGQRSGALNGRLNDAHGIPGQSAHIVGYIAVLGLVAIDKFLGGAFGASRGAVGTEEKTIAFAESSLYKNPFSLICFKPIRKDPTKKTSFPEASSITFFIVDLTLSEKKSLYTMRSLHYLLKFHRL